MPVPGPPRRVPPVSQRGAGRGATLVGAGLGLLGLLPLPGGASRLGADPLRDKWRAAERAVAAGELPQAERLLLEIYHDAKKPGGPEALLRAALRKLAGLYESEGRLSALEASLMRELAVLERAAGLHPRELVEPRVRLAELALARGEASRALAWLTASEAALGTAGQELQARFHDALATARAGTGQPEEARRQLDRLLSPGGPGNRLAPDRRRAAQVLRAGLVAASGSPAAALADLEAAIQEEILLSGEANPGLGLLFLEKGRILRREGRLEEAEEALRRSLGVTFDPGRAPGREVQKARLEQVRVLSRRGLLEPARELARALAESWAETQPRDGVGRGEVALELARLEEAAGRRDEAERGYREALGLFGKGAPLARAETRARLARLVFRRGASRDARALLAEAEKEAEVQGPTDREREAVLEFLVGVAEELAAPDRRVSLAEALVGVRTRLRGAPSLELAVTLGAKADALLAAGRPRQAQPVALQALDMAERLVGGDRPELLPLLATAAACHVEVGQPDLAEALLRRAVALGGPAAAPLEDRLAVGEALATLLADRERGEEALATVEKTMALLVPGPAVGTGPAGPGVPVPGPPAASAGAGGPAPVASAWQARLLRVKAQVALRARRYLEAEEAAFRAIGLLEAQVPVPAIELAAALSVSGRIFMHRTMFERARSQLDRALALVEGTLGPSHPATASALDDLAVLDQVEKRLSDAEPRYRRALGIREDMLGPDHPLVAESWNRLASVLFATHRLGEAEAIYQKAIALWKLAYGDGHSRLGMVMNNLGNLYSEKGDGTRAEPHYKEAVRLLEAAHGPRHPHVLAALRNYAAFLRGAGRGPEAAEVEAGLVTRSLRR